MIFTGHCLSFGHGLFGIGSRSDHTRSKILAHRFAWELANGPISKGMCVLHKCDTPACVNVEHLFLGTKRDNLADMAIKFRARKSKTGLPFGVEETRNGRYVASVSYNNKKKSLGTYDTAEEASAVAIAAKKSYYKSIGRIC